MYYKAKHRACGEHTAVGLNQAEEGWDGSGVVEENLEKITFALHSARRLILSRQSQSLDSSPLILLHQVLWGYMREMFQASMEFQSHRGLQSTL